MTEKEILQIEKVDGVKAAHEINSSIIHPWC